MKEKEAREIYENERHGSIEWEKAVVYLQAIEKAKGLVWIVVNKTDCNCAGGHSIVGANKLCHRCETLAKFREEI